MNRDYLALWGILAVTFVIFFSLAFCEGLALGPIKLKTPSLHGIIPDDSPGAFDTLRVAKNENTPAPVEEAPRQHILDSSPKCVLLIGDSMIEGLALRLSAYCDASADSLYAVIWYSSTSELYGETKLITDYIKKLHPDYIFLSLGGNELFVKDIAEKRDKHVKSIVAEIGDIPYVWIGPPNWKEDTGINALIAANTPDGCFFVSNGMHFERSSDGAHPTRKSAAEWMDSIVRWMPDNSLYYLPLQYPEKEASRPIRYFIHQPGPLTQRP